MNLKEYTVKAGRHGARPFVSPWPRFSRNPAGAWRLELGDGWDYELSRNKLQWNKACGHTFNPVYRNKNSVMLGIRRNKDRVEVSPYYNIGGQSWYKGSGSAAPAAIQETWPVVAVDQGEPFTFFYTVQEGRVYSSIIRGAGAQEVGHAIEHPGIRCWQFEINFWFGGSQPAPQRISLLKQRAARFFD